MNSIKLTFDGACDNNSKFKFMGVGVAVWVNGERDTELNYYEMKGSNGTSNIAEWEALVEALKTAHAFVSTKDYEFKIRIYGDSQTIVNQFNGVWQIKAQHFIPYYKQAMILKKLLGTRLRIVAWIPREDNKEADILSKLAITEYLENKGML